MTQTALLISNCQLEGKQTTSIRAVIYCSNVTETLPDETHSCLKQIETRQNAADGKELNNDINKIDCNERILQLLIEISIYTLT